MRYYKGQFEKYDFSPGLNAIWFKNVTENGINIGRKYMIAEEVPNLIGELVYECWVFWEKITDEDKITDPHDLYIRKDTYDYGTRY